MKGSTVNSAKMTINRRIVLGLLAAVLAIVGAATAGIVLKSGSTHTDDRPGPATAQKPPEYTEYLAKAADGEFHGFLEIRVDKKTGNVTGQYVWVSWDAYGVQETHTSETAVEGQRTSSSEFVLRGGGLQDSGIDTKATLAEDGVHITLGPTPSGVQVAEWTRIQSRADFDNWVKEYDKRVMAPCRAKQQEYSPCGDVG